MSTGGQHDGVWVDPLESVEGMLAMYRGGWFPMAGVRPGEPEGIEWVQPRRRWLIGLREDVPPRLGDNVAGQPLHVPKRLKTRLRTHRFELRLDTAFERVIRECAVPRKGDDEHSRWLTEPIIRAFIRMHKAGHAHCLEAWLRDGGQERLVGGIYGMAVGRVFCAESMFSRPELGGTDASKVCLVELARLLDERGFIVMDAQIANDHTAQFGGFTLSAAEYGTLMGAYGR
ncbi:MAG: leucyl/phenylalanyl-tRNA--protein transferase [Planctomycetes bacterium]|nr:leucyl/phenylalanyl-tRNA--protein transferase [Planctomycetota bacterium]